jgi:hypothetical protein
VGEVGPVLPGILLGPEREAVAEKLEVTAGVTQVATTGDEFELANQANEFRLIIGPKHVPADVLDQHLSQQIPSFTTLMRVLLLKDGLANLGPELGLVGHGLSTPQKGTALAGGSGWVDKCNAGGIW